jgi:hypothetical protein
VQNWSTDWSRRRARIQSQLVDHSRLKEEFRSRLIPLCEELIGSFNNELSGASNRTFSIELVATLRQSSFLLSNSSESAVLFDVTQSLILKSLFSALSKEKDYHTVAESLKECCALMVAMWNPNYARVIQENRILREKKHLLHSPDDYRECSDALSSFRSTWASDEFFWFIDVYILAHEIFHYMTIVGYPNAQKLLSEASATFDDTLKEVCYEDRPDFVEHASFYGIYTFDEEAAEALRRDLVNRRRHYENTRAELVEEIAGDAFACWVLMWARQSITGDQTNSGLSFVTQCCDQVFWMSDLHQAMIRRALLSESAGIGSELPGDIADSHFRRTAIMFSAARLKYENSRHYVLPSVAIKELAMENFMLVQQVRLGLQVLYQAPVARAISDFLAQCETNRPSKTTMARQPVHAERFSLDKLFDSEICKSAVTY